MPDFDLDAALNSDPDPPRALVNWATGRTDSGSSPSTGEVFFYVEGGDDWRPVAEFRKCKVFVFCDARHKGPSSAQAFSDSLKQGKLPVGAGRFTSSNFKRWTQGDDSSAFEVWEQRARSFIESLWPGSEQPDRDPSPKRPAPWSAKIKRTFPNGDSDTVRIIHLPVDGLAAYLRLYLRDAVAPHAICLPWFNGGHHQPLETFTRVLQLDHAAHESLLVLPDRVEPTAPGTTDWHSKSRTFPDWGKIAYSAKPARFSRLVQAASSQVAGVP